ncbi:MAG TPA: STAS domain-containing protein [Rhabdaerophilum sp.]|nr:STAS domain-containing protein [Rhabdaerophilum sp.]
MNDPSPGTLLLPADCDMQWARAFHERVLERAAFDQDIEIGAEAVERMTTPAVQVLVALSRALEAERHRLAVTSPSRAFLDGLADLGLAELAGHWSAN